MEVIKAGWEFFQNEILGMQWLNRLIGNLLNAVGRMLPTVSAVAFNFSFTIQSKLWFCLVFLF